MFAVVVTFRLNPGQLPAFLPAMKANAATSLEQEDGCHRFDVCTDPERPNEVFLYELYADRTAFDAHLKSAHFKDFDARVAKLIATKGVRTYAEVAT